MRREPASPEPASLERASPELAGLELPSLELASLDLPIVAEQFLGPRPQSPPPGDAPHEQHLQECPYRQEIEDISHSAPRLASLPPGTAGAADPLGRGARPAVVGSGRRG